MTNPIKKHNHDWGYRELGGSRETGDLVCLKCDITLEEFIEGREKEAVREALGKIELKEKEFEMDNEGFKRSTDKYFSLENANGFNQALKELETLKKRILDELHKL